MTSLCVHRCTVVPCELCLQTKWHAAGLQDHNCFCLFGGEKQMKLGLHWSNIFILPAWKKKIIWFLNHYQGSFVISFVRIRAIFMLITSDASAVLKTSFMSFQFTNSQRSGISDLFLVTYFPSVFKTALINQIWVKVLPFQLLV